MRSRKRCRNLFLTLTARQLMRLILEIMAVTRSGTWKCFTLLVFSVSVCDLTFSVALLQPGAAYILPASSTSSDSPHQCACTKNGGVCRCQGGCCDEAGSDEISFCRQLMPLAVPAAPGFPPAPPMRDYLQRTHATAIHLDLFMFLMLRQQRSPLSWRASPELPPPRLLSGIVAPFIFE